MTHEPLPTTASPLRVLVIDDHVDGADLLADLLRSFGHQVRVAYDGEAGLRLDASWQPEVVFLDLGLPGLDGCEVARRLRGQRAGSVRIVALSGFGSAADEERSRGAGCDRHVVKPASMSDILAALSR